MTISLGSIALTLAIGSACNLVLWYRMGVRPRWGFLFWWQVAFVGSHAAQLGLFLFPLYFVEIYLVIKVGLSTYAAYRHKATTLEQLGNPDSRLIIWQPGIWERVPSWVLDGLPRDRQVIVAILHRPRVEWELKQRGFRRVWVEMSASKGRRVWPVWVREAEAPR